ncbi:unnamed protein product [Bursaphelenchus okinawaensis]|uniref:DhaK domain-containing protein n=1 Tax=Bursaphelenchus okinawaensis TaxID=465554 RepID=A0A811L183_9BILA|nr:unnamed protein product [Bursaphelenchus okinawaensis]CAG9116836.1 unnamed protein product [Bursaphelenchus okinawaensis]
MNGITPKFTNEIENVVDDHLFGCVATNQEVQWHQVGNNKRVLIRADIDNVKNRQVTLVCGGGSGHEPFAGGFVGPNGLSSAVSGDVFASPSSQQIQDAISSVLSNKGTIVFSNNYTGDRLNFGMAVENLKNLHKNLKLKLYFVDDDVALEGKAGFKTGNRGLAGSVLVLQAAGAFAESGMEFEEICENVEDMIGSLATFGVSLYPCSMPGKSYMFSLPDDELELGLGIHGEPGLERIKVKTAKEIIDIVMPKLVFSNRLKLGQQSEDKIAILLNNLGIVSQMEMNILAKEVLDWIEANTKLKVAALFRGTVSTSLDGHGVSISILRSDRENWLPALCTISPISNFWNVTKPQKLETTL